MRSDKNRKLPYKALVLALLALVICLSAVLFSVAYLKEQSAPVTNVFLPGDDPSVSYRLVYDLNDGSGLTTSETATADEEQHEFTVTDVTPSRSGYKFLGWADAADARGPDHHAGDTITLTKDAPTKTLYAVWEKVADFVLDFRFTLPSSVKRTAKIEGMPTRMTAEYSGKSTHTFTVTAAPYDANFDATGLTFLGWSTVDGSEFPLYPWDGSSPIDVEVTQQPTVLYAVWGFTYYVEFDRNPADGEVGKYTADGQLVNTDAADRIVLSSSEQTVSPYKLYDSGEYHYERGGYLLVGFTSNQNSATPEDYIVVEKPGLNNAATVYALWFKGNYALVYDANGGSDAPVTQTATDAAATHTFTLDTHLPTKPENSNGKFLGWAYSATATAEDVAFRWNGSSFTPSAVTLTAAEPTRVLYAVWEYTYTLTYNRGLADADSPLPQNQTAKSTSPTYTFPVEGGNSAVMPTRGTEYLFHYWAAAEERTEDEFRYCDIANYFDQAFLTADSPSIDLWPRFRPANGYTLIFKGLKDSNGNSDTTKQFSITQSIGSFTITEDYIYSGENYITFLGWSEKNDSYSVTPQYKIGDVVKINPDTEGHTKTLYPVYKKWDSFDVYFNYNGGQGRKISGSCSNPKYESVYDYTSSTISYLSPGQTELTISEFTAKNIYLPSLDGYELKGFNYRVNGTEASFNSENTNPGKCNDDGSSDYTIYDLVFDLNKGETGEQTITKQEGNYPHGQTRYTLTLYAVWAKKDAYDVYQLILDKNDGSGTSKYYGNDLLQTAPEYSVTFKMTEETVSMGRAGYKLTGFAYDAEGLEPCASYADGHLDKDITVSQSDIDHVVAREGGGRNGGNSYTLTLYAVWEPQQVFELTLDYNGGYYATGSGTYSSQSKDVVRPPDETAYTWPADTTYYSCSRIGYVFKGYAYSKDAAEPDFTMVGNTFPDGITADKNDTHTVSGTKYGVPSTKLTLYAVWEKKQIFRLKQDFNGGVYTYSGGSTTTVGYRSVTVDLGIDSHTFASGASYVPMRSGYRLLGYAYSKDAATADFVLDGSNGFDPAITVSKLDTDPGHEILKFTSDGVDYTELTVYAVWEKTKQFVLTFDANGGSISASGSSHVQTTDLSVTQATWLAGTTVVVPTRSGYAFAGYAAAADATEPLYTLTDGKLDQAITFTDTQEGVVHNTDSAPETHTLTLYAVWKPLRRFVVSIDRNLPDGSTAAYATASGYYDKSVTKATISLNSNNNSVLTRQYYYNLKGAAYTKDAKTVDFVGDSFSVVVDMEDKEHDITVTTDSGGVETVTLKLYAIWSMTLDYYGGNDLPTSVELINPTAEERVIPIAKSEPTYQSFRFAGWTTTSGGQTPEYGVYGYYTNQGEGSALTPEIKLEKNTTLYAVWIQKYMLAYDANGGDQASTPAYHMAYATLGSDPTTTQTFIIGTAIPTREGYTFLGWAKDSTATEPTHQPGKDLLVSGNADGSDTAVTLYAVWQEDTATEAASAAPSLETDSATALPDAAEQNE